MTPPRIIHLERRPHEVVEEVLVTAWDAKPPYQYVLEIVRETGERERDAIGD